MDDNLYRNSVVHHLGNMPKDHPYIEEYNSKTMIVCLGEGEWEHLVRYKVEWLEGITREKGIHVWYNWWDGNSVINWVSRHYQLPYFLEKVLP